MADGELIFDVGVDTSQFDSAISEMQSKVQNLNCNFRVNTGDSNSKLNDTTDRAKRLEEALGAASTALIASGIQAEAQKITAALKDCVNSAMGFESAMVGVAKTNDMSDAQLESLGNRFIELSQQMPTSANELAEIAMIAGQLGISTSGLEDFTLTMANMAVATNLSSEEAATAFARIGNIMQLSESEYANMGAAVVALGNNFATSESEIVEMTNRLASGTRVVGIDTKETLALATAMSSVGIKAEAGGTAMTQTLTAIERQCQQAVKSYSFWLRFLA